MPVLLGGFGFVLLLMCLIQKDPQVMIAMLILGSQLMASGFIVHELRRRCESN